MEILMNIKCSTNGNASIRPTLKVVDQHQQLQQQHNPLKSQRPNGGHHTSLHGKPPNLSIGSAKEIPILPFMEYTAAAASMDCCSPVANPKNMGDIHWSQATHKRGGACNIFGMHPPTDCPPFCEYASCCTGTEMLACCASYSSTTPTASHFSHTYLDSFTPMGSLSQHENQASYEYHEPEENFVSIEDEKIKAFLVKIGEEQKIEENKKQTTTPLVEKQKEKVEEEPVVFEIIELDDEEERERLQRIRASAEKRAKEKIVSKTATVVQPAFANNSAKQEKRRKSPSISLIPKTPESSAPQNKQPLKGKEKIIASIDLIDSSDTSESENESFGVHPNNENCNTFDDENDDSVSSRLIAAAAVSCELGCSDDNDRKSSEISQKNENSYSNAGEEGYIFHSEDEENIEFIEEQEEGLELHWDDLEDHSNSRERQLFECPVCGKKVQSNYNLRRHMMIHTGERPFGCDLCERRFREISDLKKHRRRHASEKDFVCMICRINPPLETDSTRCNSCDTKNGTLIAAVRPDTVKTPPEIEQMFGSSLRADRRKFKTNSNSTSSASAERTLTTPPISGLPLLTPIPTKLNLDTHKTHTENLTTKTILHSSNPPTLSALPRKEFPCPMCKRAFGTRHNLKRHFMIHTGEKPFDCPSCRKPFREYSTLKKHLVTHRRDRWYKCVRCAQKYRDYLDYVDHKSTHGSDVSSDDGSVTPKKRLKYQNDDQDDTFYSNDEDEDDDDDYTSALEDSIECCECGQRFNDIEQFTDHIKEHDSNRIIYECYICKQLFEGRKDLVKHMNVKHQTEEPEDEKIDKD